MHAPFRFLAFLGCSALALAAHGAMAQDKSGANLPVQAVILRPASVAPSADTVKRLQVPKGFAVSVYASGLQNPRMMATAANGDVYVTQRQTGNVVLLRDTDNDGAADKQIVVATLPQVHGIVIAGERVFLATVNDVYATTINAKDGSLAPLRRIIDDLPDGGQHPNRTLALGPDEMLYITVGSTCNACTETNPESATILRAKPDGTTRSIYATGLRNTIGFGWHPVTGEMWGMDHGIDWLGDDQPPEELNKIEQGKRYGWPYIAGKGIVNPQDDPPGGITHAQWTQMSEPPMLAYTAHAAPMQMLFYVGGNFPPEYNGDAFVAMRGSWNRSQPSGYEIVRVRFKDGAPQAIEPFLTGFVARSGEGWQRYGRLAGLTLAQDGSLLVSDDDGGVIYRVRWTQTNRAEREQRQMAGLREPTQPQPSPEEVATRAAGGKIAIERIGGEGRAALQVRSPVFNDRTALPERASAYAENVSPALQWSGAPAGVQSYAVILEDPDADSPKPFVHWLAYNIPATLTMLPDGVTPQEQVKSPAVFQQGVNSRGSAGYYGPKPPPGDRAHRYVFQVFALDRRLDLPPGTDRETLLKAMEGHVIAAGQIGGLFEKRR
jgi:Raf kinase inhibitor-like YbhB/YbcL family protein